MKLFYKILLILWHKRRVRKLDANKAARILDDAEKMALDYDLVRLRLAALFEVADEDFNQLNIDLPKWKSFIDEKCKFFDNKYFQSGALEDEIFAVLLTLLSQKSRNILEIGVANGYSSYYLYKALENKIDSKITSVDLPRFEGQETGYQKFYVNLLKKNIDFILKNERRNVMDYRPGALVPYEKFHSWLVPTVLRAKVRNNSFIGNAFNILPKLDDKFDFFVLDAMKDYNSRYKLMDLCYKLSAHDAVFIMDGAWINNSFYDFCKANDMQFVNIGRVSIAKKNNN